ncbi:hypothetical protein Tco_1505488 [Tanacetum coccineum]
MRYLLKGARLICIKDFVKKANRKSFGLDRIVVHETNEAVYEENIAFLKYDVQVKDISIKDLKNQFEEALKEKDDLKDKLENFEESSKNLTKLINSQISAKDKSGLGYDSQRNESELNNIYMNKSEVVHSVFNSRESDVDDSPVNDRSKGMKLLLCLQFPVNGLGPQAHDAALDNGALLVKRCGLMECIIDSAQSPQEARACKNSPDLF